MSSTSTSPHISSNNKSPIHISSTNEGNLKVGENDKPVVDFRKNPKNIVFSAAITISFLAGVALFALSATCFFGPSGSLLFITTLSIGSVLELGALIGAIGLARSYISSRKTLQPSLSELLDESNVDSKTPNLVTDHKKEIDESDSSSKLLHQPTQSETLEIRIEEAINNRSLEKVDLNGQTLLHEAVNTGNIKLIQSLLKNHANPFAVNKLGQTPLHLAVINGNTQAVKDFLEIMHSMDEGSNNHNTPRYSYRIKDHSGKRPVDYALEMNKKVSSEILVETHAEIISLLEENNAALSETNYKTLSESVQKSINENNQEDKNKLLIEACKRGYLNLITLLHDNGADLNIKTDDNEKTLLHIAARKGHIHILNFLIEKNVKMMVDKNGKTPLHYAASHAQVDCVRYLLIRMNYDISDSKKMTALELAAEKNRFKIHDEFGESLIKQKSPGYTHLETIMAILESNLIFRPEEVTNVLFKIASTVSGDFINKTNPSITLENIIQKLINKGANINEKGETPLHKAIVNDNVDAFNILKKIYNLKAQDSEGRTPLLLALKNNHTKISLDLLAHPSNSITDCKGRNYLHYIASNKSIDILICKKALKQINDLNATDNDGMTALHLAAQYGNVKMIQLLKDSTKTTYQADKNGKTPLHYIVESLNLTNITTKNFIAAMNIIMNYENFNINEVDLQGQTALAIAIKNNGLTAVKFLIKKGAVPSNDNNQQNYLHHAAAKGSLVLTLMSSLKIDINAKDINGLTPLHISAQNNNLTAVEFLIKKGAVPSNDKNQQNCLHHAAAKGSLDLLTLISSLNIDINAKDINGLTALDIAAQNNNLTAVKFLIENGAVPSNDKNQQNCLHHAAAKGSLDLLTLISSLKIDINAKDINGLTPLAVMLKEGDLNLISSNINLFIDKEAVLEALDNNNQNVLHYLAEKATEKLLELIIPLVKINQQNTQGMTPLHISALNGNSGTVNLLIKKGADISIKDVNGKTALDLAKEIASKDSSKKERYEKILQLLERNSSSTV